MTGSGPRRLDPNQPAPADLFGHLGVSVLPIRRVRGGGYRAILELDVDECENIAHALGLEDGGAQELLSTAERMRQMAATDA